MSLNILKGFLFASLTAILVSGCGGGAGGGAPEVTADNGTGLIPPVSKTVQGPITGFGSVIVSGVRFETSSADVTVEGQPGNENQLQAGHIVTVRGSVDAGGTTGKADKIKFEAQLRGAIESIDLTNSLIVALGQVIMITDTTSFGDDIDPASIDGLGVGDSIEVSGFADASGNIVAMHIERNADTDQFKVKGIVSNLDMLGSSSFQIESLTVFYAAAMLDGFPDGMIRDGNFVEVKCAGTVDQCFVDGVFQATKIELEDDDFVDDGEIEIEGIITRFMSVTDFDVALHPVTTTDTTLYVGGTAADLADDVRVEVEGTLNDTNVLVAAKVKIKHEERIRVTAAADMADADARTLTILGITFEITDDTRFKDKSAADLRMFGLPDIVTGDPLEVRGYQSTPGMGPLIATRVERQKHDSGDAVELQAYVEAFDPDLGSLILQGVTVNSDSDTQFSSDFFMQVVVGSLVRVRGDRLGDMSILASQVTLKHDDMDDDDEIELEGFVTNFDSALAFDVAGLAVTTNDATEYKNGVVGDLALHVRVEVKGFRNSEGVIVARRIKFENDDDDDDDQDGETEIEGFISGFIAPDQVFNVADHPVATTPETIYEDGTMDDLANGVPVEVEGMLDDAGILVASEIEFEDTNDIRITGIVQSVETASFSVLRISVGYEDGMLAVGDSVKVRARQRPPGTGPVVASAVEPDDESGRVKLRAYVDSVAADERSLVVLGVSVLSTADTIYTGHNDMQFTVESFFDQVRVRSLVEIRGVVNENNVVTALTIELERM